MTRLLALAALFLLGLVVVSPSTSAAAVGHSQPGHAAAPSRKAQNPPPGPGGNRPPVNATRPQGGNPGQAQQPGGQTGQAAPTVEIESSHSYVLDAAILVLLYGGTLFLICRSAGRV